MESEHRALRAALLSVAKVPEIDPTRHYNTRCCYFLQSYSLAASNWNVKSRVVRGIHVFFVIRDLPQNFAMPIGLFSLNAAYFMGEFR